VARLADGRFNVALYYAVYRFNQHFEHFSDGARDDFDVVVLRFAVHDFVRRGDFGLDSLVRRDARSVESDSDYRL
jgi:hypothetical protein